MPLLVLAVTGSPAAAGLAAVAGTLPLVLLTLPAGAILDRVDRRRAMVACEVARGLAVASLALAVWAGRPSFAHILVVAAVGGAGLAFFAVAERSAVRQLVPARQVPAALAQTAAREFAALTAGQAAGGLLFGIGRLLPLAADAASFVVSAVTVLLVRRRLQEERAAAPRALRAELGDGLRWVWRQPLLRTTALLSAGLDLVTNALYLAVIVAAQRRGASPALIGALLAFVGVGGLAGALLAPRLARRLSVRGVALVTLGASAGLTPLLAVAPSPLAIGALYGATFLFHPTWSAVIGARQLGTVPDRLQGRVQGAILLLTLAAIPAGQLGVGVLLQAAGPTVTILLLAAATWVTLGAALRSRSLRTPPDRPEPDAQPARPAEPLGRRWPTTSA